MNKKEIYDRIRNPGRWDEDFFQSIVTLSDRGELKLTALEWIVREDCPNSYNAFIEGQALASNNAYVERIHKRSIDAIPTAASITPKETEWLYKPYIPRGKLTLIGANPGVGKTFLMCYIAACVSTGKPIFQPCGTDLFDGIGYSGGRPGHVLYITAEDGADDTIVPRLQWCGADLNKIRIKECESKGLTYASAEFRDMLTCLQPDLVIADPFQNFFTEKADINAPNKTRAQLFPVIRLARETNAAIVLVCHLNKNKQGDIISRILGSMDIVGCCRSMLAVGNMPGIAQKDMGQKFISHEKSSLAKAGNTYLFRLDPEAGGVVVDGMTTQRFDDYAKLEQATRKRSGEASNRAKQFLMDQMPDGSRPLKELKKAAEEEGISEWALKKAAEDMEIVKKSVGFPKSSIWYLPGHDPDSADLQTVGSDNDRP